MQSFANLSSLRKINTQNWFPFTNRLTVKKKMTNRCFLFKWWNHLYLGNLLTDLIHLNWRMVCKCYYRLLFFLRIWWRNFTYLERSQKIKSSLALPSGIPYWISFCFEGKIYPCESQAKKPVVNWLLEEDTIFVFFTECFSTDVRLTKWLIRR